MGLNATTIGDLAVTSEEEMLGAAAAAPPVVLAVAGGDAGCSLAHSLARSLLLSFAIFPVGFCSPMSLLR